MNRLQSWSFLLIALLALSACSRDLAISTVLEESGGLRAGDKVYLEAREVGSVASVAQSEGAPGVVVSIGLYPEHAELVQSNAVAYVPLQSPPSVTLVNPLVPAAPVAAGAHLKGLSPLQAALWQVGETATAASAFLDGFARDVDRYFESERWAETQVQIDSAIAELAEESTEAAERIVGELEALFEATREEAAAGAQALEDETAAVEAEIRRLQAEGHAELAASLRRLLAQLEALAPPPETTTGEQPRG
jgi:hypothetical protein